MCTLKKIQISESVHSTLYVYKYRNDSRYRLDHKLQATMYHTIAVLYVDSHLSIWIFVHHCLTHNLFRSICVPGTINNTIISYSSLLEVCAYDLGHVTTTIQCNRDGQTIWHRDKSDGSAIFLYIALMFTTQMGTYGLPLQCDFRHSFQ